MLIEFFLKLKQGCLPVSVREFLTLLEALEKQVIHGSVDDFYYLSRACMVKDESNYDKFDRVFGHCFKGLELGVMLAEFVFVHAGINPRVPLEQQSSHDVMWIRGDFTHAPHSVGKTVVFGHTPFEDVLLHLPYKIGIDTGLVFGNRLSVVELVHGQLYQIEQGETKVKSFSLRDRLGS